MPLRRILQWFLLKRNLRYSIAQKILYHVRVSLPTFINIDESISLFFFFFFFRTHRASTTGVDYSQGARYPYINIHPPVFLSVPRDARSSLVGAPGYRRNLISKLHANLAFHIIHFAEYPPPPTRGYLLGEKQPGGKMLPEKKRAENRRGM